jgi:8-hydroxy-5-deazaflavin:NADPH oxidoreductase
VGVSIAIGSRSSLRAEETVERASFVAPEGQFSPYDNAGAVAASSTVILSVPFRSQSETLTNLRSTWRPGQLVIDATVPLAAAVSGKATRTLGVWQGSAAQQTAEMVPDGVRVVSALHTVSAASLSDLSHPLEQDVLVCGDEAADKDEAAILIERIDGLRCVDCGRLEMARITESITAMLISVNVRYKSHAGVRLTSLPARLWD